MVLVEVLNRFDNNADNCVQGEQEWNDGSELLKGVTHHTTHGDVTDPRSWHVDRSKSVHLSENF